jgi:predicted small lipoprotein YifL
MRALVTVALLGSLAGCGDKVPQSEAAKQIGNAPKQTVDKATQDTGKALQQGADRTRQADQKSE